MDQLAPALEAVDAILAEGMAGEGVPGAVALVRREGETVFHRAYGQAAVWPTRRPMALDTVFDLASLTKPLATTPVVLKLVEQGLLSIKEEIGAYLPELRSGHAGRATVGQLLDHTSGIRGWFPLYSHARQREDVLAVLADLAPASPPGTRVEYSCLNFILLGIAAERITGRRLDQLAHSLVFAPLGLHETGYCPKFPATRYASTEQGNGYEMGTVAELGEAFDRWRTQYVPGTVHDGNAWYAMGGISGNAGLFSTAEEVGILGQMWLNGGEYGGRHILAPETIQAAIVDRTPHLESSRSLGWLLARPPAPGDTTFRAYGTALSPRAFGHTGFTGTSIWVDPDRQLVMVLLTNRVHTSPHDASAVTALRHRFHNAAAQLATV